MSELFTPALVVYAVSVVGALVAGRAFRSVHKQNVARKKRMQQQVQPQKLGSGFVASGFGKVG